MVLTFFLGTKLYIPIFLFFLFTAGKSTKMETKADHFNKEVKAIEVVKVYIGAQTLNNLAQLNVLLIQSHHLSFISYSSSNPRNVLLQQKVYPSKEINTNHFVEGVEVITKPFMCV